MKKIITQFNDIPSGLSYEAKKIGENKSSIRIAFEGYEGTQNIDAFIPLSTRANGFIGIINLYLEPKLRNDYTTFNPLTNTNATLKAFRDTTQTGSTANLTLTFGSLRLAYHWDNFGSVGSPYIEANFRVLTTPTATASVITTGNNPFYDYKNLTFVLEFTADWTANIYQIV